MMKKIALILCVFLFTLNLSACGYIRQINEMAYVVGVGIDKGERENILLSLQFAKPNSSQKSEGGGDEKNSENKSTSLSSAEEKDIFSAMAKIESSLSKQINLTHAKILVFSDEIAKEGILKYAKSLMGNNQFRPNTYAAVSSGSAKEYFEKERPALESNPAKYYTLMFSKDTKSFLPEVSLRDLYFNISSPEQSAVLPVLGGGDEENASGGMAVFKGDTLAGIFPPSESEIFNIITGDYKEGYFNVLKDGEDFSVRLKERKKPDFKVETDGGKITAKVKLSLSAEVMSYPAGMGKENIRELETAINNSIAERADEFIFASRETECDAVGFSRFAKKNFLTIGDWENFGWAEKYPSIEVKFDVQTRLESGNLIE